MGRVWIGIRERVEHLRRLSVVFAVPIRLKIVTELYQREMSPTQFYEEFGGGSPSRICKHFERLRGAGWLTLMWTEEPGGARRGGRESIYRATELAFCDRETWIELPYSLRIVFSWNCFKEIAEHLRGAMEALTFQARPDRRLTGIRLLLDWEGWMRIAKAVSEEFAAQFEEQENARRRAERTGEKLLRFGSLLLAFELPIKDGIRVGPKLATEDKRMIKFPVRVSKVFEDEVCLQIVDEANRGDISIPVFHKKHGERFGLNKSAIRRRFKKLVKYGWLKVVDHKTGGSRRGGTEHFYRATGPAVYDEDEQGPWAGVPEALSGGDDWRTFMQLTDWVKAAVAAGTMIAQDDTCLAWTILNLDQKGWERVVTSLRRLHAFVLREYELAEARLEKCGEEPMAIVVGLGAFETPKPVKEP